MISAKVVADSKNTFGQRITTLEVVFPRMVLAEFNTHRLFTRNSASSRAIPYKRMREMVLTKPFIPLKWQKDHTGMQGTEYHEDPAVIRMLEMTWLDARDEAVRHADMLVEDKVTKQLANRLLEPYMYHTVLVTATEWGNFLALRAHEAAEIHIAYLAELVLEALNESTPKQLQPGEWHIPYGDGLDESDLYNILTDNGSWSFQEYPTKEIEMLKVKIAVARCARLSYKTLGQDAKIDYAADIRLHDVLLSAGHFSPFEHVARAMTKWEFSKYISGKLETSNYSEQFPETSYGVCGNFRGFIQYRKMIPNENKIDTRLIKK